MNSPTASRLLSAALAGIATEALAHPGHGAVGFYHHFADLVPLLALIAAGVAIAAIVLFRRGGRP